MIKKRMTLSLVALVGSVFLFVIASFAWFTISDIVNLQNNIFKTEDIDVSALLYVSADDITYIEATSIDFQNKVPGDIIYYKVILTNNNDFEVGCQASLYGFTDFATDDLTDTSNYSFGRTIMDYVLLNSSNNINSDTLVDQILSTVLISSQKVITHEDISISALGTAELYFSFTLSAAAGNDYQNLGFDITSIYIQSVDSR